MVMPPSGVRSKPNFVATTTSARCPALAFPTSRSLVKGPYMSAVWRKSPPSTRARWIVAIASPSLRSAAEPEKSDMPMQPSPIADTSRSPSLRRFMVVPPGVASALFPRRDRTGVGAADADRDPPVGQRAVTATHSDHPAQCSGDGGGAHDQQVEAGAEAPGDPAGEQATERSGAEEGIGIQREHPAAKPVRDHHLQRRVALRRVQREADADQDQDAAGQPDRRARG